MKNSQRAITNATIATVKNGQRVVRKYQSGERLVGRIPEDDAPPFTGYVLGWFRNTTDNRKG
jgi:hypothetical protein